MSGTPPSGRPRVAVTVEQSWQRVPGGTASSTLALLEALGGLADGAPELVGVAARHRRPAPAAWRPAVPVHHLPLPRRALYAAWSYARWPPADLGLPGRPVDVVHATSPAVPPRSSPLVATVHDLAFLDEPAWYTPRGVRFLRRGTELARRHADAVVVPSSVTRERCLAAGFEPGRVHVVPHGVAVPPVTEQAVAAWREQHGLGRDYVLWCGTREPRKNLAGLLAGFALLAAERDGGAGAEVDLVLVGPNGWGDLGLPAEPVAALAGRVHAVGFLPPEQLHAAYAGARAFCYPSLLEGFGLPVLEAMAHGVPVVTSTGSAMAEFAGGAGALVDPRDPTAVAAGLAEVLSDDGRLARAAREAAARRPWSASARALADLYRSVSAP